MVAVLSIVRSSFPASSVPFTEKVIAPATRVELEDSTT